MDEAIEVKLYGGPKHGKRVKLRHPDIAWITCAEGHYARVQGGLRDEFYWKNFKRPIAYLSHGILHPIREFCPPSASERRSRPPCHPGPLVR